MVQVKDKDGKVIWRKPYELVIELLKAKYGEPVQMENVPCVAEVLGCILYDSHGKGAFQHQIQFTPLRIKDIGFHYGEFQQK